MKTLKPAQAAKILGMNTEAVRLCMQSNSFTPFIGTACKYRGGKRYTYEIFPDCLAAYLHISLHELFRRLRADAGQKGES